MTSRRSIAAAQTIPTRGDVDANVEEHVRLVQLAAEEQAQVLVFPELSLTGYELDLAERLAFLEGDRRLAPLIEASSSFEVTLIVGAPVRLASRLHVGAFVISPDRTVAVYTKHRLGAFSPAARVDGVVPPAEATVFHPGTHDPLVHFQGNVGAVAVCADIGNPSHPQHAADRGAKTYLASMFIISSEYQQDAAKLGAYAAHHRMAVVLANYGGPSGGLRSAGRSTIWSDTGALLAQLDGTGSSVVVAVETDAGWVTRRRLCR